MIKVENVTKKYGNFVAVDNISFEIGEGEIIGFLGPNGAGKTTTMSMITGFIEPTEGKIEIDGYDISKKAKKAKRQIGYMPENVPLYSDLTVKEFVTYIAELKNVSRKQKKEEVQRVLKATQIDDVQNKLIKNLSRGYKQRVSMAGALVGSPKVLILDEPTVGLDPKQVTEIRNLIKSLGKEHTVILSSHILSEVSQICEKVIIINHGKIIAQDTPQNLEEKVKGEKSLIITVEDKENKTVEIINKIENVKSINLINENQDGTKQYSIVSKDETDIRKEVFEVLAKNEITILEIKKSEVTLEDAFINLIDEKDRQIKDNKTEKGGKK